MIRAVRESPGKGDAAIRHAADSAGIHERLVRIAVDYAAEHLGEIEERLAANAEAVERVKRITQARAEVLA